MNLIYLNIIYVKKNLKVVKELLLLNEDINIIKNALIKKDFVLFVKTMKLFQINLEILIIMFLILLIIIMLIKI